MAEVLQAEGLLSSYPDLSLAVEQPVVVEILDVPVPVAWRPHEPLGVGGGAAEMGGGVAGVPAQEVEAQELARTDFSAALRDCAVASREGLALDDEVLYQRNQIGTHEAPFKNS